MAIFLFSLLFSFSVTADSSGNGAAKAGASAAGVAQKRTKMAVPADSYEDAVRRKAKRAALAGKKTVPAAKEAKEAKAAEASAAKSLTAAKETKLSSKKRPARPVADGSAAGLSHKQAAGDEGEARKAGKQSVRKPSQAGPPPFQCLDYFESKYEQGHIEFKVTGDSCENKGAVCLSFSEIKRNRCKHNELTRYYCDSSSQTAYSSQILPCENGCRPGSGKCRR